eukprot:NODE_3755_length_855_cov_183.509615_g3732_i0.p1 GENE.NODE_3755_length_855_cov_183.509615_g3732_i0~~NODE_3755_length_855_cov_183.509615_g3732_i0.p1  ORF type:complete len:208 (-),score=51.95 NODE_3755_length_855_cov_183.509615_g3732_i0:160-783(-)
MAFRRKLSGGSKASALDEAFDKYKKAGIESGAAADEDSMVGGAFMALAEDLGISVEDPVLLILAWKISPEKPMSFSRAEWSAAMKKLNVTDVSKLKALLPSLKKDIGSKAAYKDFYNFVFDFIREDGSKNVSNENAVGYWQLLLAPRWKYTEQWCEFIAGTYKKAIVKDVWKQLLDFSELPSMDAYDPNGAWPTVIDEFVEYIQAQQ